MFLGTGGPLGDEVVFTVRPNGQIPNARLYWTARSYDTYLNGQWVTSIASAQSFGPGDDPFKYPQWNAQSSVSFTFYSRISLLQTLFYTGEPTKINRDVKAILAMAPTGEVDLNALVMDPPLKAGEQYTVDLTLSTPQLSDLINAGTEYPKWVTDRYLQLPDNFSPRVAELAKQIAGEQQTPYDQANAITQYLRRTITYSETIPAPPANTDPIEWFLFDTRAGFCNYYATSEVLMLRSLGVPARLSAGYAQGQWDQKEGIYTVIGKESHAWPEVYFPTVGWVIFEPTVSQPAIAFSNGNGANPEDFQNAPSGVPTLDPNRVIPMQENNPEDAYIRAHSGQTGPISPFANVTPWMIATALILLIGLVLIFLEWRRRRLSTLPLPAWIERSLDERGYHIPGWLRLWSQNSLRTPMENLFMNVGIMLRIWGQKVAPSQTPAEQVNLLISLVPDLKDSGQTLLEEYQRALYSRYPANLPRARHAVDDLRITGLRNWVLRLAGLESA